MENRGKRQASSIFGGMGFYIALLVCVLAAGVVGYFALLNKKPSSKEEEVQTVDQTDVGPVQSVDAPEEEETSAQPVISDYPLVVPSMPSSTEEEKNTVTSAEIETEEIPISIENLEDLEDTHVQAPVSVSVPSTTGEEHGEEPREEAASAVIAPLEGETIAVFSAWELVYDETLGDWRTHNGIDIRAAAGTAVSAACDGTVLSVEEDDRLGTTVVIDHNNGYVTTYASLQPDSLVLAGDEVDAGTVIGTVGNTSLTESALGAHLHFSVSKDGEPVNPNDFLEGQ